MRLALTLALVWVAGCSTSEFAPDAVVSSSTGGEVAVRSWEFCGPTDAAYECLDSLPNDDLPVLTVPIGGSWTIDRPAGYTWELSYRVGDLGNSTIVMSVVTETGDDILEFPPQGTYIVELGGRADETVGAWTFELVVHD
jgi:hypothetical protein